jgi:hypothetical protein
MTQSADVYITQAGRSITTGGTSAYEDIPPGSDGAIPSRVRLACTAACHVKFGHGGDGAATASLQAVSGVVATAGTGHVPGDVLTLAGGTSTTAAKVTVSHTKAVSATVVAGGTGGTPGAVTITGTTGTGTKFQATGTIGGDGILAGALVVSVAGDYAVNPTDITAEPVTGGALIGCTVSVVMGAKTVAVSTAGEYSVIPANDVAQGASTGAGINAAITMAWGVGPITVTNPGSGYVAGEEDDFTLSGGSGSGASLLAVFTAAGAIESITAVPGTGYTTVPTVIVTAEVVATSTDMLLIPGPGEIFPTNGRSHIAAIQSTGAGVLQISPIEN